MRSPVVAQPFCVVVETATQLKSRTWYVLCCAIARMPFMGLLSALKPCSRSIERAVVAHFLEACTTCRSSWILWQ